MIDLDQFNLGAWKGERSFRAPPDVVFAQLMVILEALEFSVTKIDPSQRALVAERPDRPSIWLDTLGGRVAAAVDSAGGGAVLTMEWGPMYAPSLLSKGTFGEAAVKILDLLQTALDA
jgi:hypothetical protein